MRDKAVRDNILHDGFYPRKMKYEYAVNMQNRLYAHTERPYS
jgi:hypothetical protein